MILGAKLGTRILVVGLLVAMACGCAWATVAEDGRVIAEKNGDAVISVEVVIESTESYEGESSKRETRSNATGTIIDPSGLLVSSLSAINPTEMYGSLFADDMDDFGFTSDVVDVKIRMSDGKEVSGDVVLRDRDLDLAFIKPKDKLKKDCPYVDLTNAGDPQMMDEVVMLSRLGKLAGRSLAACVDRVQAVVTKPRKLFVVNENAHNQVGVPAFCLDGKPAGILVMRTAPGSPSSSDFSFRDSMMAAVLPCSTVARAAEQAKEVSSE